VLHVTPEDPGALDRAALILGRALGATVHRSAEGGGLSVAVDDPARANGALGELLAEGVAVSDFRLGQPSLDEVFFALTGRPQAEEARA
jgi:ABC-2 type transport system ATP-binding protein